MKTVIYLAILLFSLSSLQTHAAVVKSTKADPQGKMRVLIDLQGKEASEGDLFLVIDPNTKKPMGEVRVDKIRGDQAIGVLTRGKVTSGAALNPRAASSRTASPSSPPAKERPHSLQPQYGILGGITSATMSVKTTTSSTTMTGMSFGLVGFYDLPFNPSFGSRFWGGIEGLSVSSGSSFVNISYLGASGVGKWIFMDGESQAWLGAGGSFLIPMMKSAKGPVSDSNIGTNQVILLVLGFDLKAMGQAIPLQFEYGMFPDSTGSAGSVSVNQLTIRAGVVF